jgi:predicted alpha/beta hydrolase
MWCHPPANAHRPVIVITGATSVRCRYYSRFADYLYANGFNVVTYDYRGIGESRPASLRRLKADWVDWGEYDLDAILKFAEALDKTAPIYIIGHSIGGFAIGLAPMSRKVRRILTVGANYAYWGDYAPGQMRQLYWKWHVIMPFITYLFGYFPAKRLGWMEDTPAGVVQNWCQMTPRFEDTVRQDSFIGGERESERLKNRFETINAPILAIGLDDDPYATVGAVDRLLNYFSSSQRTHLRIAPADVCASTIGHFGFFHVRFKNSLWPLALTWLQDGILPATPPGRRLGAPSKAA